MSWSSQSRNTLTITYFWCVFSACEYLSHTTPCFFSAMRICLFRNGKSSRSKVLMVKFRGLTKGFWEQGYTQSMWVSVASNHIVCKVAEMQWWRQKRERNGREVARLATGGRYLLAGRNYFRKISKFAVMFMGTFYFLMLLTTSKIVISLNLPGLKLQFKG